MQQTRRLPIPIPIGDNALNSIGMVPGGGILLVRTRHRHGDFQRR